MAFTTKHHDCVLRWDSSSNSFSSELAHCGAAPAKKLFSSLKLSVQVDGEWIAPASWNFAAGVAKAETKGLGISLETRGGSHPWMRAKLENKSGKSLKFGGFKFAFQGAAGGDDMLSLPGERMRVYREGWTGVCATGTVRFGEADYDLDPGYLPFAVTAPELYDGKTPNRFSCEYATVLNDAKTGVSALFGFISSAEQITRLAVALEADGSNSVEAFSCGDDILVEPGESVLSEELVALSGPDGYALLEEFAGLWGARMKALTWSHAPTGWCSWYYYFEKVTEKDMLSNSRMFKERKAEFPIEYIQLDDGYQRALGDWLECIPEKFPSGLESLAKGIKADGFKPAIWLAPFMVGEDSNFYAAHPDWVVLDAKGEPVWITTWRGARVAALDCSRKEALEWLKEVFGTLAKQGYEYFKLDFLMYAASVIKKGGRYADPKTTRAKALRNGLQAIRDAVGDRFIVGATMPLGSAVGVVNGERIGTDITPYWQPDREPIYKEAPCVPNVSRNIICRRYMHWKLWVNDPDVHIARADSNKLTESEVKLWTSVLWLTGGMLLLSDRMDTLAPDRAQLSKTLLGQVDVNASARPLDFFESAFPSIWLGLGKDGVSAFLGLFDFETAPRSFSVPLEKLGFARERIVGAKEIWSGAKVDVSKGSVEAKVEPHSCALIRFELKKA